VTAFALALLLVAATLHATWNLCAKRAGGGLPFVWLVGALICAGYVPVLLVVVLWKNPALPTDALWWIVGSGVLKTSYSLFLQRGYRHGDFSLIYPLARGTGPLLSMIAAVLILGERPSALTLAGGAVIVASIFWLTGGFEKVGRVILNAPPRAANPDGPRPTASPPAPPTAPAPFLGSVGYGVISGVFIASYTLWDRHGVAALAIAPLLWDAGTAFTQLALLTPFAVRRWPEVVADWRTKKHWAFGVALLSPVAYVLVLTAMSFTPVSTVAPAREVSIVIGAFFGAKLLKEADGRRRLWAAAVMALGVAALALG
jgi:drug/metabolite transporter (DMT)-like permease